MEEDSSVANTNVADEHLWPLSFYKCHVYVLQLSDLTWGLKRSLPGQGKGHGVKHGCFSLRPSEHHSHVAPCATAAVVLGF